MKIVRIAFFAALCAATAFAADFTGTWTATITIPAAAARGGRGPAGPVPFIVHIKPTCRSDTCGDENGLPVCVG